MKIIVAGSRNIVDPDAVHEAIMDSPFNISEIVSGNARGVDILGEEWAKTHNVPVVRFPAMWDKHGKSAGYLRNIDMAKYADALVAVWDGKSKGTFNMIHQMVLANKPVYVYCPT